MDAQELRKQAEELFSQALDNFEEELGRRILSHLNQGKRPEEVLEALVKEALEEVRNENLYL